MNTSSSQNTKRFKNFDFSKVEFQSDDDADVEENDLLGFLSEQTNKNIHDLLETIGAQPAYVKSGLRVLHKELTQSFETMSREYFEGLLRATLKKMISIGNEYVSGRQHIHARDVLTLCNELFSAYERKNFQILDLHAEFGNIYAMLQARLDNYRQALIILDETLDLQKRLGMYQAVTLLNRSKVLALNGSHEESCRTGRKALQETKLAIDQLGYFDLRDEKCLELHKTLVLCYYNIGVEESSLGNPDVAALNFEEAYKTSYDNFGEEDILTQKMKESWKTYQKQLMHARKAEMRDDAYFQKNKFLIRDRRIIADEMKPFKNNLFSKPPKQLKPKVVEQVPLPKKPFLRRSTYSRPQSSSNIKSSQAIKVSKPSQHQPNKSQQTSPKTVKFNSSDFDEPSFSKLWKTQQIPREMVVPPVKKKKKDDYFDNSDAYQSDAPSKSVKGFHPVTVSQLQPGQPHDEIKILESQGILSWENDVNPRLNEPPQKFDMNFDQVVIIKDTWEQELDDDEKFIRQQQQNRSVLLNQLKNLDMRDAQTVQQRKQQLIAFQNSQIQQKQSALFKENPIFESKRENSKPDNDEEEEYKDDFEDEKHSATPPKTPDKLQTQEKEENNKSVSVIQNQNDISKTKTNSTIPRRRVNRSNKTAAELKTEYMNRMKEEMEQYLMECNQEQKFLDQKIKENLDKEQTMILINKKKKEQIYGAQMGLEMLQERYNQQKKKLEEMLKHEMNQQKVIDLIHTKRQNYLEEYQRKVQRFHAANVIKRYLMFARDRRAWDNYKLHKNKSFFVIQEFKPVKLTQRIDIAKVAAKAAYQSKGIPGRDFPKTNSPRVGDKKKNVFSKQKANEIVFGTLAIFIDLNNHQLQFKFYAPPETLEFEKRRLPYYHQLTFQEVEFYYGRYMESERTRQIVANVLDTFMKKRLIVDYAKVALLVESQSYTSSEVMEDSLGDIITLSLKIERPKDSFSNLRAFNQVLFTLNMNHDEEIPIDDVNSIEPQYYYRAMESKNTRQMISRIFTDEKNDKIHFKLSILQIIDTEEDQVDYYGQLRYIGELENLYRPHKHYLLKCKLLNYNVIKEMQARDYELPMFFEIDLKKKIFKSRPKALREEDIIKLQQNIRRYQAQKHLKQMVLETYYVYFNKVLNHNDYMIWLRITKHLNTQRCKVLIETLDRKVFMNEDQKRMVGQFNVDEHTAKILSKQSDPIKFFLINENRGKIKLMRLMLEAISDKDVRRLQTMLRTINARRRLKLKTQVNFQRILGQKYISQGRSLFLRIQLDKNKQKKILEVFDLVPKRLRLLEFKTNYKAKMIVNDHYATFCVKHPQAGKLFDYDFNNQSVNYTHAISKIQGWYRKIYHDRHRKLALMNYLKIDYKVKFNFIETKARVKIRETKMIMILVDLVMEGRKLAYFCSLSQTKKDYNYLSYAFEPERDLYESSFDVKNPLKLYTIDFAQKIAKRFTVDIGKIINIQNSWLRKLTRMAYKRRFETQLKYLIRPSMKSSDQNSLNSDVIFCYLFDEGDKRTLYCESLGPKILNSRFKIIRRRISKQLIIDKEALTKSTRLKNQDASFLLFDFEMRMVTRLQLWGRQKYLEKRRGSRQHQLEFYLVRKYQIDGVPYVFGQFIDKEHNNKFMIFLSCLRAKLRHAGEQQYFYHSEISKLLFEEMLLLDNPGQIYLIPNPDYTISLARVTEQKSRMIVHEGNEIEVKISLDKCLSQLIFETVALGSATFSVISFNQRYLNHVIENVQLYIFKNHLKLLVKPNMKKLLLIQQRLREKLQQYREGVNK